MQFKKQVDKGHYDFARYMSKPRWVSVWHQIDEIQKLNPECVLEIGPGPGIFRALAEVLGIKVQTLDMDPELKPDFVASVTKMPFSDSTYDVVCAFQMLEHLPYELSLQAFEEMARVSRRNVVISLPDALTLWRYHLHIPIIGGVELLIPRPRLTLKKHMFDGEHYWEINKRDYRLSRIVEDFTHHMSLIKTYRVPENPYHRFFVFEHKHSHEC